jgi:hypothetical protein
LSENEKAEETAEKTGEVIGMGLKKDFCTMNAFEKGAKRAVWRSK